MWNDNYTDNCNYINISVHTDTSLFSCECLKSPRFWFVVSLLSFIKITLCCFSFSYRVLGVNGRLLSSLSPLTSTIQSPSLFRFKSIQFDFQDSVTIQGYNNSRLHSDRKYPNSDRKLQGEHLAQHRQICDTNPKRHRKLKLEFNFLTLIS